MSQPILPNPERGYTGFVRDVLGEEYRVVLAVYQQLDSLRDLVKNATDLAQTGLSDAAKKAGVELSDELASLQKSFNDTADCAKQKLEDDTEAALVSAQSSIKHQLSTVLQKMSDYEETLLDNLNQTAESAIKPYLENYTAKLIESTSEAKQSINDVLNSDIIKLGNATADKIAAIQAAQSSIQWLSYGNSTTDLTYAPKPNNQDAPAILYFSYPSGSTTAIDIRSWDTANKNWDNLLATLQPGVGPQGKQGKDGAQGSPGATSIVGINLHSEDNTVVITASMNWSGGSRLIDNIKWPGNFIFKTIPQADFTSTLVGDTSGSTGLEGPYDPSEKTSADNYGPGFARVYNVAASGFTYQHIGPWPGSSFDLSSGTWIGPERLLITVVGEPDWAAMKAAGWTEPDEMKRDRLYDVGTCRIHYHKSSITSDEIVLGQSTGFDKTQWPDLYERLGTDQLVNPAGCTIRIRGLSGRDSDEVVRNNSDLPTVQEGSVLMGTSDRNPLIQPNSGSNWQGYDPLGNNNTDNLKKGYVTYSAASGHTQVNQAQDILFGGQGDPAQCWGTARMPNINIYLTIVGRPKKKIGL